MMAMRLSDSELAGRVRAGNRQRAQRQHERRRSAGLVATTVWLSASTKAALFAAAQSSGETASNAADRLLSAALEGRISALEAQPPPAPVQKQDADQGALVTPAVPVAKASTDLPPAVQAILSEQDPYLVGEKNRWKRDAIAIFARLRMAGAGHSTRKVARELATLGYKTANGKARQQGDVDRVLNKYSLKEMAF